MVKNTRQSGKLGGGDRFSMTFLVTLTRNLCLSKAGLQRDVTPACPLPTASGADVFFPDDLLVCELHSSIKATQIKEKTSGSFDGEPWREPMRGR